MGACVGMHAGPDCSAFSEQPPRGSATSERGEQSNKRRRIPRPGLAGPVLLNLSSMILPFSRGGAVGPEPGAPALSSPNQAPYPGASQTSAAGLELRNSAA